MLLNKLKTFSSSKVFAIRPLQKSLLTFISIATILCVVYSAVFLYLMRTFEAKSYTFFDAVYWVVSTMITLGYGDIVFTTLEGRLFSIVVALSGIVLIFAILIPLVVAPIAQSIREILPTKSKLKNHILIIGYNTMIETLIEELQGLTIPFLIIESDKDIVRNLIEKKISCIYGDLDAEDTLTNAQIADAKKVILNRGDEENANIGLAARHLTKAEIIGFVEDMSNAIYLKYAGVNKVLSPKQLLGINIGRRAAMPLTHQLASSMALQGNLRLFELSVMPDSDLNGKSIADAKIRERTGATVIGHWEESKLSLNPRSDAMITDSSVLILIGTKTQLEAAKELSLCRTDGTYCAIEGHYVVAGNGDVGKRVSKVLRSKGIEHVIIDKQSGDVVGSSTNRNVLKEAGISDASTLIVAVNNDIDSIYTTLIARRLNPNLDIICRAVSPKSVNRLYRAGADFVFSQSAVAGQMLAKFVEPDFVAKYEREILLSEDLKVIEHPSGPSLIGKSIASLEIRARTGSTVVGIKYDGSFVPNPHPDEIIPDNSIIVIMGSREQISKFRELYS